MADEVFAGISQGLRAAANNVDLIPNVIALLPNVIGAEGVNQLRQEMQEGFAQVLAVCHNNNALGLQSAQLGIQNAWAIQQLRDEIRIYNHNTLCRQLNSLRDGNERLEWLQNQAGMIPQQAPFAEAEVHRCLLEDTNALLAHYGLQLAENQHPAAERLLQFLGRRRL